MKFNGACRLLFEETNTQLTSTSFKKPSTNISILQLAESYLSKNREPLATFCELMSILPGDVTFNNFYPADLVVHLTYLPKGNLGVLMYPLDPLSIKNSIFFWDNLLPRVSVLSSEVNITSEEVYWYVVFEDRRKTQKGRCVLEIHTTDSPASTLADFKYKWGCS